MALASQQCLFAQKEAVQNLVFEGAGIRGLAYAGAIAELEKENILDSVQIHMYSNIFLRLNVSNFTSVKLLMPISKFF